MPKKFFPLSIVAIISVTALASCDNTPDVPPDPPFENGERIPEDLTSTNIIDDDYRNFYEIFVGSYYDSNGDHVGDLQGVIKKLDYIEDLGYNGIWLMPIFTSPSYHKYDSANYLEIDPNYGTMDDLEALIDACHERGINIILDLMINHSSVTNTLFTDAAKDYAKYLNNPNSYTAPSTRSNKDWYVFSDSPMNGYSELNVDGKTIYYESNFSPTMPEFNLDNDDVRTYFEEVAADYLNLGIDGFRLDAVIYYYYMNHEKNYEYLTEFHDYCASIKEDVYIVGECWQNNSVIKDYYANTTLESYFYFGTQGPTGDIVYSTGSNGAFADIYYNSIVTGMPENTMGPNGVPSVPAPFLDNHDVSRIARSNVEETKFFYGLLAMMNGTPFTYYGDEIGMVGSKTATSDLDVRTYMLWDEGDFEGKCNSPQGANESYIHPPVDEQLADDNSILNYYKKANLLRNQLPSIARGEITNVGTKTKLNLNFVSPTSEDNNFYMNIEKTYGDEVINIIINYNTNRFVTYDYLEEGYNEVVGQLVVDANTYIGLDEEGNLSLPPRAIAIVKQ